MSIACSALLLAWVHFRDELSVAKHASLLAHISGVDLSEIVRCRNTLQSTIDVLLDSTSLSAPASTKGAVAGRESPTSIMDGVIGDVGEPNAKRHAPTGTFSDHRPAAAGLRVSGCVARRHCAGVVTAILTPLFSSFKLQGARFTQFKSLP